MDDRDWPPQAIRRLPGHRSWLMRCVRCGAAFPANQRIARFCSDRCRRSAALAARTPSSPPAWTVIA